MTSFTRKHQFYIPVAALPWLYSSCNSMCIPQLPWTIFPIKDVSPIAKEHIWYSLIWTNVYLEQLYSIYQISIFNGSVIWEYIKYSQSTAVFCLPSFPQVSLQIKSLLHHMAQTVNRIIIPVQAAMKWCTFTRILIWINQLFLVLYVRMASLSLDTANKNSSMSRLFFSDYLFNSSDVPRNPVSLPN